MVSTIVAPAMMAVRRASAAIAAINGATMNSEITIRPDAAASTQGRSSHKTATAMAACPAGRRDSVFTPALVDPRFMGFPLHLTGFSARPGHAAALAPRGTPYAHASARAVRAPGVRQHRQGGQGAADIDAELSVAS